MNLIISRTDTNLSLFADEECGIGETKQPINSLRFIREIYIEIFFVQF